MLKKTITYTDFDGNERKEDFYFNLTKAEVTDWLTTSRSYTLDKVVEKLIQSDNTREIIEIFKDLVYRAYGEKSLDGRRFIKSKEVKDNFIETEAYSVLYMELVSDAKVASDFIAGIIPSDWANEIKANMNDPSKLPESIRDYVAPLTEETTAAEVVPISGT